MNTEFTISHSKITVYLLVSPAIFNLVLQTSVWPMGDKSLGIVDRFYLSGYQICLISVSDLSETCVKVGILRNVNIFLM
jgi:hypothetical protein